MGVEIIVPLSAFLLVFGVIWVLSLAGQRKRQTVHETLRLLIEKGQPLTPEMIKDMSLITDPRRNDLRRGVVLVALALALGLVSFITSMQGHGDGEAAVVAVFPGVIGLAFLGLWKFGYDGKAD